MGRDTTCNSTAMRQRARATRPAIRPVRAATWRAVPTVWGLCRDTILYRDRGACNMAPMCHDTAPKRRDMAHDTAPRCHDTVPSAP